MTSETKHTLTDAVAFAIKAMALAGLVLALTASDLKDLSEVKAAASVGAASFIARAIGAWLPGFLKV